MEASLHPVVCFGFSMYIVEGVLMNMFFIQDENAKEARRDHRGRPKGKQRELARKGRYLKRGHGREETSPGMCAL